MKKYIRMITISLLLIILTSCTKEKEVLKVEEPVKTDIYLDAGINKVSKVQQAPDFQLNNINGEPLSLSDFKGQVILLNFWASWCGPCISEMPSIETLYKETKDSDIKIIAVNIGESVETAGNFIKDKGYTFETLFDPDNKIATLYGVRSIPTTYIIDKNGNIVAGKLGAYEWDNDKLKNILQELTK